MKIKLTLFRAFAITAVVILFSVYSSFGQDAKVLEHQKTYTFQGTSSQTIAILEDLEYYGKLHPLITEVQQLDSVLYRIKEKPYPKIPVTIKYNATITKTGNEISYHVTDLPWSEAFITYVVTEEKDEVVINFILRIESRLLGKKVLFRKMISAQDKVMAGIEEELRQNLERI